MISLVLRRKGIFIHNQLARKAESVFCGIRKFVASFLLLLLLCFFIVVITLADVKR